MNSYVPITQLQRLVTHEQYRLPSPLILPSHSRLF